MSRVDPSNPSLTLDAVDEPEHPVIQGQQHFAEPSAVLSPVSAPVQHMAARKQVTGEAQYTDDIPQPVRGLYAHFVMSPKAHATFRSLDASAALKMPGVVAFFAAKDIPGKNQIGPVFEDEELFAAREVLCVGHPVGIIVAETHAQARDAARFVKFEWESDLPVLLKIEEAIAARSFLQEQPHSIVVGDVDAALRASSHVVQGDITIGGQEHFYLEPQTTYVEPTEEREMRVWSSTQNPTKTQQKVAAVLGVPQNRVIALCKRMGGGFGGKETRSVIVSAACAVAAHHLNRPVRMVLDRDVDFAVSGTRHAFRGQYRVGFNDEGVVSALDVELYSNAGYSMDLSFSVMDRALFHSTNAYRVPHVRAVGHLCKTNIVTATAFRGFGAPQGMMVAETWIDHVARTLRLAPETVRARNLYKAGDFTHFRQRLDDNVCIGSMYETLRKSADFDARAAKVAEFNAQHVHRKRGLCLLPTVFGMSFTAKFMNQAGALVHLLQDGSVQVHHGGTEMGQGLHTKMAQIAAHALGVTLDAVHVVETATDKVANTSPTAASVQSDINGGAVLHACDQLAERLKPLRAQFPDASFADIVSRAHHEQINLSAQGFYKTPDIDQFDFTKPVEVNYDGENLFALCCLFVCCWFF
jgi:xanthine dehydrogenase/oxidase